MAPTGGFWTLIPLAIYRHFFEGPGSQTAFVILSSLVHRAVRDASVLYRPGVLRGLAANPQEARRRPQSKLGKERYSRSARDMPHQVLPCSTILGKKGFFLVRLLPSTKVKRLPTP